MKDQTRAQSVVKHLKQKLLDYVHIIQKNMSRVNYVLKGKLGFT